MNSNTTSKRQMLQKPPKQNKIRKRKPKPRGMRERARLYPHHNSIRVSAEEIGTNVPKQGSLVDLHHFNKKTTDKLLF